MVDVARTPTRPMALSLQVPLIPITPRRGERRENHPRGARRYDSRPRPIGETPRMED
jgi:hypothetical protein